MIKKDGLYILVAFYLPKCNAFCRN